jgi:hypothetical protein
MNSDQLIKRLNSTRDACKVKMEQHFKRGDLDMCNIFESQDMDCQITLSILKRGLNVTQERLIEYILEDSSDLTLIFNPESVRILLADMVKRAYDKCMCDDLLKDDGK